MPCETKRKYMTASLAEKELDYLWRAGPRHGMDKRSILAMSVYRCRKCGCFHLGRSEQNIGMPRPPQLVTRDPDDPLIVSSRRGRIDVLIDDSGDILLRLPPPVSADDRIDIKYGNETMIISKSDRANFSYRIPKGWAVK